MSWRIPYTSSAVCKRLLALSFSTASIKKSTGDGAARTSCDQWEVQGCAAELHHHGLEHDVEQLWPGRSGGDCLGLRGA